MTPLTTRQKHRRELRGGKRAGDPLVPIDFRCLAAAIDVDGRSLEELAAQATAALRRRREGCSKQRLHHLAHHGKRCRASLRRALARLLLVREDYLAGQRHGIRVLSERAYLIADRDSRAVLKRLPKSARDALTTLVALRGGYDVARWRRALLDGAREPTPDELDDGAEHASALARIVFEPWLKGNARLRSDGVRKLASLLGLETKTHQPRRTL